MPIKRVLVAIGHKSRVGKDTFIDHVNENYLKLNDINYATLTVRVAYPVYEISHEIQTICITLMTRPLLETASRIYGVINDKCHIDAQYPDAECAVDKWISRTLISRILQEGGAGKPGTKVPWLLQMIGTDLRNIISSTIWSDIVREQIDNANKLVEMANATNDKFFGNIHIFVPDMRFPDEYRMLKELGFTLIRVDRPDRPIDRDPNHPSETALDDAEFDYIIDNSGTLAEYRQKIDQLMVTRFGTGTSDRQTGPITFDVREC